jgi:hypothetical protein
VLFRVLVFSAPVQNLTRKKMVSFGQETVKFSPLQPVSAQKFKFLVAFGDLW